MLESKSFSQSLKVGCPDLLQESQCVQEEADIAIVATAKMDSIVFIVKVF